MYESILVQTGQIYKYALNSNISVTQYYKYFLSKNKTKAKLRDIEAAYFVRTESIHPISDKIKVGASYRFRSDNNNNSDIYICDRKRI